MDHSPLYLAGKREGLRLAAEQADRLVLETVEVDDFHSGIRNGAKSVARRIKALHAGVPSAGGTGPPVPA